MTRTLWTIWRKKNKIVVHEVPLNTYGGTLNTITSTQNRIASIETNIGTMNAEVKRNNRYFDDSIQLVSAKY